MSIEKQHPHAAAMSEDWLLIDALRGGTRAMRRAGEIYLPKRPLEDVDDYKKRLGLATLYPAFSETVTSMAGRVFSRPLIVTDDVPGWIKDDVLPDIDMQGRNLHVFVSEWFREAFEYGLSHVIIDSPIASGVRTIADQKSAKVRPYAIRISPHNVLGWRTNDAGELTQLRVRFSRITDVGPFGVAFVDQIRVYEVGSVTTHEKDEAGLWTQAGPAVTIPMRRIPLVTLYTKRTGKLSAEPPLRELAFLNAKHWSMQSSSDTLLDTASVPILSISGVQDGDEVVIGAKHAVKLPQGATMAYVEHTGSAIGAGREALDALKDEMRQAGAKMLATNEMAKNIVQAGQEAARENSALGAMVQTLEDTIADMLDMIAEWRGETDGGTIQAQPNLDADFAPIDSLTVLIAMRDAGNLSDETLFAEAKRRNIIADDINWKDELDRIANNPPLMTAPPPVVPKPAPGAPAPSAKPAGTKTVGATPAVVKPT